MGKALPDDLNTLKVTELKEALRERSLAVGGVKADLVARLQEYLSKENKEPAASDSQNGEKGDDEQVKESEKEKETEKEKEARDKEASDKQQREKEQKEKELKEKEQKEKEQREKEQKDKEEKEKKEKELKEKERIEKEKEELKAKQLKEKEQKEKAKEKDNDTEEPEKDEEMETKEGKKRKTTDDEEPSQSTPSRTLNHPSSSSSSTSATSPSSPTNDSNKRARSTWTNKPQSITISSDILKEMLPTPSSPTSSSTPADAEMDDAGGAQDDARTSRPAQPVYSAPSRREKKEEEPAGPREVPASRKPASNTLYIDRFVRPFTIPQVRQLLSQTGEIETFWMNQVKSQAYVTFKTVEQASATREAIFDLTWPPGNGSKLRAEFATEEEGKKAAEQHDLKRSAPTTTAATTPANVRGDRDVRVIQDSRDSRDSRGDLRDSREVRDTRSLRDVRDSRDSRRPAPPPKKTLEDLFKKTVALPSIYWLGLTAEQIAAKKSAPSDRDR